MLAATALQARVLGGLFSALLPCALLPYSTLLEGRLAVLDDDAPFGEAHARNVEADSVDAGVELVAATPQALGGPSQPLSDRKSVV